MDFNDFQNTFLLRDGSEVDIFNYFLKQNKKY